MSDKECEECERKSRCPYYLGLDLRIKLCKPGKSPTLEMDKPKWTVCYNIVSPENSHWIGRGWEFFDSETDACLCYDRHVKLGNCPTKRPYYHKADEQHLGACHRMAASQPTDASPSDQREIIQ